MILVVWGFLIMLALAIIVIGYWKDIPLFCLMGIVILFLMAFPLMTGLEYQTGATVVESGGDFTITNQYSSYANHFLGWLMAIVAVGMFTVFWIEYRSDEI